MVQGTKRKGDAFAPPLHTKPQQRLVAHQSVKDVVHTGQVIVIAFLRCPLFSVGLPHLTTHHVIKCHSILFTITKHLHHKCIETILPSFAPPLPGSTHTPYIKCLLLQAPKPKHHQCQDTKTHVSSLAVACMVALMCPICTSRHEHLPFPWQLHR